MVSRPCSGELQPRGVIAMRSAIAGPYRPRNLLLCKQFGGIAIATEAPLVAIPEKIRCKCRPVPCTVVHVMVSMLDVIGAGGAVL